jgi:hypothetical protein
MIVRAKTKVRLLILLASVVLLIGAAATVYVVRKRHITRTFIGYRAMAWQNTKTAITLTPPSCSENLFVAMKAQDVKPSTPLPNSKHARPPTESIGKDAMTMLSRP